MLLLPCAINASCAALVDAGIPLKHLAVAICCGLAAGGDVILDPTILEEQEKMKAVLHLIFPNPFLSIHHNPNSMIKDEAIEQGIISSITRGAMSVPDYERCLERGRAACAKISEFLRRSLRSQDRADPAKAN